jgi:hypothetical protein
MKPTPKKIADVGDKIVNGVKEILAGSIGLNRMPLNGVKEIPKGFSTIDQKNKENL